ncbi:hypothetical protein [Rodentibacter pneumotropicus]|uniref:Uncharacterized protein n=1 Tax=Rodentibacter pneumotropicus TaxID=758 RepID=A0A4V6RIG9_9PAST|nr:hypothetical protein [Rodentibacter pneumotropicus]THA09416.1 hypothetical protein D3M77_02055 [Rodentibacter pneumotropicus]THA18036.1 hypothetical protein D3M76_00260 [Rodentibacter pneumotropicus]
MKDLNRFEYLQLAAALVPESKKEELLKKPEEMSDPYALLSQELWVLAKSIRDEYYSRYDNKTGEEEFDLLMPIEKANEN